ncbi:aminomethyl-transferring glycine dehydrogenase subunit GcvPB [Magnetospirillum moscoviense]|uniref:glycine dehydrogenase (aminomethyl-transferring) n=1 Tax=Magnetospirillum moscoviense TaxID=1437059 RepID=A0A178MWH5_9PROT|nr:aminomethyl-transferring glycine dehydrogenase subunit GcvPB [Magnetospirillum moscoviense]MBF0327061.1 aminomethyl-transferring glycine dehydrogenase subunit GcvPB [Alphaproteobacteria bacterium]OAN53246.1 glycine dehydrogenase (aminomethyl-transferring) [Magnetospirillum moscoviense]
MSDIQTISGHRGLLLEEPLIFEQSSPGRDGIDLPEAPPLDLDRLGGLARKAPIGLPDLSEPQMVRHYTRLSQKNYGIDSGFYPLGSCTMKHNPRLSEKVARLPGLADLHPFQPQSTIQGALEVIDLLAFWLKGLTGMPAVAMSPAAGAHGEWCGLMAIRAYHEDHGQGHRRRVLVPESAHGTNPASAAMCGFTVDPVPANALGRVDVEAFKAKLGDDVACIMVTNPNTCGLFETEILEIAKATHEAGAFFYCDGANYNAIVGRVKISDLGIDCMHINLHKTFSTPHGGGGPGSGPTVLSDKLAPYAPLPFVVHGQNGLKLIEHAEEVEGARPFGRVKGFHGQFGVFIRALAYILSMGGDGMRQASTDAVLNANYLLARLKDVLTASFDGPCMHECLFDDRFLKDTGVSTLDFAKMLIDEGFHPMTMYFPLVVHGALLMEPTESETKETLDGFIRVVLGLAAKAKDGQVEDFKAAPRLTPRRRLDETLAARTPVLRWKPGANSAS